MLLDRDGMLKQGKHRLGPFLRKSTGCALKLGLSHGYVTPRATPFAQTHPRRATACSVSCAWVCWANPANTSWVFRAFGDVSLAGTPRQGSGMRQRNSDQWF